ncbi:MAG: hypothetical protein GY760_17465 [Deltaproteobacteria bacterium]|nr:hypothetical protein [Deltaproteobacteria bacterium]
MKKTFLIFALMLLIGCSEDDANPNPATPPTNEVKCTKDHQPKGDRLLGMDILDPPTGGTFDENYSKSKEFGLQFTGLHIPWDKIEQTPGNLKDPDDSLSSMNSFCSDKNIKLSLTIRPIDLTGKTVPTDLINSRFNAVIMKNRFKNLIDFIFTKIDYTLLTSLQIGNEIDHYDTTSEHPDFWSDYGEFLYEIRSYIDVKYPELKTGFTVTLLGNNGQS